MPKRMTQQSGRFSRCAGFYYRAAMVGAILSGWPDRHAAAADDAVWLGGSALQQRLAEPIGLNWSQAPRRSALVKLARLERTCLLLDRRIDPSTPVDVTLPEQPLRALYERLARNWSAGFCELGPVGYFGPTHISRDLRTVSAQLHDQAARLETASRQRALAVRGWHWAELATPRELLTDLAAEGTFKIEPLERVPHDLWPATDLAPLAWIDRLLLVVAQFDLAARFSADGQTVELVPWPERPTIERQYPGGSRAADLAERFWQLAPASDVRLEGTKLVVRARLEDHERFAASRKTPTVSPRGPRKSEPGTPRRVYTLNQQNVPLNKLLAALSAQSQTPIRVDERALADAGISADRLVSLRVEKVELDELLKAALEPAGLTFRREGEAIVVTPDGR